MTPAPAALADIPATVAVPWGVPVLADRAYDSDPLREQLDRDGFRLLARHRQNRTRPPVAVIGDSITCRVEPVDYVLETRTVEVFTEYEEGA